MYGVPSLRVPRSVMFVHSKRSVSFLLFFVDPRLVSRFLIRNNATRRQVKTGGGVCKKHFSECGVYIQVRKVLSYLVKGFSFRVK